MAAISRASALCCLLLFLLPSLFSVIVSANAVSSSLTERVGALSPLPTVKQLGKRQRRGGGGGGGGGGRDTESDSDDEEDEDDGPCEATTANCYLTNGYGKWYRNGPGSRLSRTGGFTPDGSGDAPRWSNETGAYVHGYGYPGSDGGGLYLGGAFVPFPAGQRSPNGVEPSPIFTMPYHCHISGGGVAWSGKFHLYPYEKRINWTTPHRVYPPPDPQNASDWFSAVYPVYCGCSPDFPCGCDDHHRNDSFVDAVVGYVFDLGKTWVEGPPKDGGHFGCNATVNGEPALVVEGTLARGSSKRDPAMERTDETEENLTTAPCTNSCQGMRQSRATSLLSIPGAYVIGWVFIVAILTCWTNHFPVL